MKWKRAVCVIVDHEWILGRLAAKWARALVKRKSYHNRACTRCEHEEWNADEVEREALEIQEVKRALGTTEAQARPLEDEKRTR